MFKKIHKKLDSLLHNVNNIENRVVGVSNKQYNTSNIYNDVMNQMFQRNDEINKIFASQHDTIVKLTDVVCEKYKNGLFIMSDNEGNPIVIKDGEIITDKKIASFNASWAKGEFISLSVDYIE